MIDDEPVAPTERFVAEPETITRCFEKWEGKRVTDRVVARLGERLPPRSSVWELGLDGHPRNPWSEVHYLGLTRIAEHGLPVGFAASSDGGKKAIARLAAAVAKASAQHPGMAPIVVLSSDSYTHRTFGKVLVPQFDVVSWTTARGAEPDESNPPLPARAPDGPGDYADIEVVPF